MDPRKLVIMAAVMALTAGCSTSGVRHGDAAAAIPTPASSTTTTSTTTVPETTTTSATTVATTTTTTTTKPTATTAAGAPVNTVKAAAVTTPCPENLASELASTGPSRQLITVVAAGWGTSVASVELWQRSANCWVPAGGPWTGLIGQNGFSDHHIEGDSTTPTGRYGVGPEMYGNQPDPGVREEYHQLVCGDWWDEDSSSPGYNTFQHVPCGEKPPFGGGSEALWQETAPYPSFAVIDYNTGPILRGAGSAIFFHADTGVPTSGCVSIPLGDLDFALRWIDPSQSPAFVMGPASEITRF